MIKIPFIALFISLVSVTVAVAQRPTLYNAATHERVTLSNGWHLTPVGRSLPLGDLPLNLMVSPSKKYLAVTNNGQSVQSIQLIDAKTEQVLHSVVIPKSWYGLKFSANEKFLYASGGNDNWIMQYAIRDKKLVPVDSIRLGDKWPTKIGPAGIEIDDAKKLMYVVTRENNSLYIIDLASKKVVERIQLSAEAYTCRLSPDKKELYISLWGGDKLVIVNTARKTVTDSIAVGDNPNELCITKNGRRLFVANANDNSVSVIDVAQRKVMETLVVDKQIYLL
jgi:YVTN family beta-propeller protein